MDSSPEKTIITPELKEKLRALTAYLVKHLGIQELPRLKFISSKKNADDMLGITGYYDNEAKQIVIYITDRHPKDVLRSYSHEMVHRLQDEHGNLHPHSNDPQYAQHDQHLRKMEMEAYLLGNILFRDFCDAYKYKSKERDKI